ncbi:FAD-binding oxidoreductase [Clostridium sp. Sa3CUN1]|uniref:FAD-binding oxidoreductase n=1 Tax=Clostridium gallinarum TaxID=2762246 RepID=A0ABR8Q194_9CLOT|nr:FAD-dependent oxidoreductase [Clostridium gallinarum]MBD7914193.1 FAD-binding oxidoreductase [Clostridium gallinarum]
MNGNDYSGLTGKIVTKESCEYNQSIQSWNRAIEKYPSVIIYCYNDEDVINAVKWARNNSKEIRVRSGGHNYEGYSTGNNLVVIDVSKINSIYINEKEKIAKLGGGVRNREAYEAFGAKGYAFPGGGCPTVGVSGLILGGGWGYSSRYLGLASDSLVEAEIINYEGKKLVLNKNENSDLFWAIMGSGGCNFGIITSMTVELKKEANRATLLNINYPYDNEEVILNVILEIQKLFKNLDIKMNFKTAIYNSKEKGIGVKLVGLFYGSSSEAKKILKPILNITDDFEVNIEEKSLVECNRWIQDSHPEYEKYKSTGRFVFRDYSEKEISNLIKIIKNPSEGFYYTAISLYGLGGVISNINKLDTAYYYRDASFIMGIQSVWDEDKYSIENREWVKKNFKFIKTLTDGSFVNFPLDELESYEKEYYGDNIFRLRDIKRKYDPYNMFDYPQSIKVKK